LLLLLLLRYLLLLLLLPRLPSCPIPLPEGEEDGRVKPGGDGLARTSQPEEDGKRQKGRSKGATVEREEKAEKVQQ